MEPSESVHVIDSHTAGEPTRVVISGGPDLGQGPLRQRLACFQREHDRYRSAIINEPRGSDALVGALLCAPNDNSCAAGVVFFNNVGYLGMCGHGTIGLVTTLAHLGRLATGRHCIETPVGIVETELHDKGAVTFWNVPSYRLAKDVSVELPGFGVVTGDVAFGGNWFFLTEQYPADIELANLELLTEHTWRIREALVANGITGADGHLIDHIEISQSACDARADSRNFVLCPGKAYDRSPCGTGTSAKLACLYEDGKLQPGAIWRQQSITGSVFEGTVEIRDEAVVPRITGSAFVTAEARLILTADDPLRWGMPAATW